MSMSLNASRGMRVVENIKESSQSITTEDLAKIKSALEWIDAAVVKNHSEGLETLRRVTLDKRKMHGFNRRSEIEVIASILDTAKSGVKKTRIMYQANLSYTQLQKYLSLLTKIEMLSHKGRSYQTTNRGDQFLFYWTKMLGLLEAESRASPV